MTKPRPTTVPAEGRIEVARSARYFTLGDPAAAADEVWIVLHGIGQLASQFITYFADLDRGRRLIVAPEALNRYYTASISVPSSERPVGATWMTKEDRDAEIRDYVRYLDLLHARLASGIPNARVVVLGFSQGGATAARWTALGAARIDRVILWGALLPPDLDLSKASATFRGASLTYAIGNRDQYISAEMIEKERVRLAVSKMTAEIIEFEGGHSIKRSVLADLSR